MGSGIWLLAIAVPLIVVIAVLASNAIEESKSDRTYDERQKIAIGKAAIPALRVCGVGNLIGAMLLSYLPVDGGFMMIVIAFAALTVYAVYAIREDAYFGISDHWKATTALFLVVGALNVWVGAADLANGVAGLASSGGKLTISDVGVPIGIAFLVIGLSALHKHLSVERESQEI